MRKVVAVGLSVVLVLALFALAGCESEDDGGLVRVRLNEVVNSIFYAPQYAALALGFFEEEGLEIILSVGNGADRTMTALLTGEADIGLMGIEAGIYVYSQGREDYAMAFAQLTQRAGNFLVAREPMPDFAWSDVAGRTIIGGRVGGMPQMVLEYILRENGIDLETGVDIVTNLAFTTTAGAFAGGIGDFTAEFEPTAFALEQAGHGHVVAALGLDSGIVPYTVYMATLSFIEENPDIIQSFTNAVQRGMTWVAEHSAMEIAEVVHDFFPAHSIEDLAFIIDRYKAADVWKSSAVMLEDGFYRLQHIMDQSGQITEIVPFDTLITNEFAQRADR